MMSKIMPSNQQLQQQEEQIQPQQQPPQQPQLESQVQPPPPLPHQHKSMWTSLKKSFASDKSPDFAVFKLKHGDTFMPIVLSSLLTLFYSMRILIVASAQIPLFLKMATYIRVIVIPLMWCYVYLLKHYSQVGDVLSKEGRRVIQIGNAVIIVHALYSSFVLIALIMSQDECNSVVCMQDIPAKTIPLGVTFQHVIGSIVVPLFFTCHDVSACFLSIFIAYSLMVVAGALQYLPVLDLVYIGVMGVMVFLVFVSYEVNAFFSFSSYSQFEATLLAKVASDNKEYLMQIQTEEMRHMIGERREKLDYAIVDCAVLICDILYCVLR
jgi:hypothetical protein